MKKMYKDGITKFVNDREVQEYKDWGFVEAPEKQHKPEPMVIKPTLEELKKEAVELGIQFAPNIGYEALKAKIEKAKEEAEE